MSASHPIYQYQPLPRDDCIRLLVLLPGSYDEPKLSCRLLSVPLEEAPSFEALSYVWGTPVNTAVIDCCRGYLPIRANLETALRQLRHRAETRWLWVDALCINQEDDSERGNQVRMMGLIYFQATRVVIWLGLDDTQYEEDGVFVQVPASGVFETISKTAQRIFEDIERFDVIKSMPVVTLDDLGRYDITKWKHLSSFIRLRPWFHRGWVIQEIGLAGDSLLVCGSVELGFWDYIIFVRWLVTQGRLLCTFFCIDVSHQELAAEYWQSVRMHPEYLEHPSDFLSVLAGARGVQCTDERDYVYAFLGHPSAFQTKPGDADPYLDYKANYTKPTIVQPNYAKAAEEVYMEVAQKLIHHMGNLDVLCYVNHTQETFNDKYPTWFPRWNLTFAKSCLGLSGDHYYSASMDSVPTFSFQSSGSLNLKGHYIDVIDWVNLIPEGFGGALYSSLVPDGSPPPVQDQLTSLWNMWKYRAWQKYMSRTSQRLTPASFAHLQDNRNRSDFLYTLTAGLINRESAENNSEQFHANVAAFERRVASASESKNTLTQPSHTSDMAGNATRFLFDLEIHAEGRVFFSTMAGRIGLGHLLTKVGDECWIIAGAATPFLLRPSGGGCKGQSTEVGYKMIGEAYLHGVMRGEAFKKEDLVDVVIY
ncbi:HET-domain-containing protein [Lindgomyces ingoldianus]|uniref:HET-domain-containing protein n=1 Tax=Lindgomyces ingoldianus TaxID=673940 RepID=A0ACB6QC31_9PLEO|nr:HET-domain-containing protein [Lindgomyces ingoldianus]KAF2464484.1 HET-domain-containing protein [Lindgomyces ingoldianus]